MHFFTLWLLIIWRQVVHHLADVEMNAYNRLKRGLTEEHPVVGIFREDLTSLRERMGW